MYKVYDYYEGKMLIGESESWLEAKQIAKQFKEDTDGECDIEIVFIPKKGEEY